jgi:hypothetical protein
MSELSPHGMASPHDSSNHSASTTPRAPLGGIIVVLAAVPILAQPPFDVGIGRRQGPGATTVGTTRGTRVSRDVPLPVARLTGAAIDAWAHHSTATTRPVGDVCSARDTERSLSPARISLVSGGP